MMSTLINTGSEKKVRLFVATAWAGERSLALESWGEELPFRIKIVPDEQLHLTWCFLGHCHPAIIPKVTQILADATQVHAPIEATVQPPIWWPQASRATGIACPVEPVASFQALAKYLQNLLMPLANVSNQKNAPNFRPHITLARLKAFQRGRMNLKSFPLSGGVEQPWSVDHISLYQSQLTDEGPIYSRLYTKALQGKG
ncbi:MAG TPA: RNA 2',3'-cyclic phosphodiesterase [Oculatellaceae cyanobacterium]|jgi:2'-5' RNA ligase